MLRWLWIAVCLTTLDVNNAVCRALCRQDGYDVGSYAKGKCLCANEIEFEVATEKRFLLKAKRPAVRYEPPPSASTE